MTYKRLNIGFAVFVLIVSLIVLMQTVQPSVSFWDCGEFIAAAFSLQVPHPPGTPFFLLLGRVFSMLPIAENVALKVNMISVLSSAFSVFLLYLIIVKLIENYRGKEPKNLFDAFGTYAAATIGAFSLLFADTFWFNAVEAEVYAASTFLFALITYLMMVWHEKAHQKDSEKYLILIAYLLGLSTGVHLMSVLAIVTVVMIIMFRKYLDDEEQLKKTVYIFLANAGVVLIAAVALWAGETSSVPPSPEEYKAFDQRFIMIMAAITGVIMLIFRKHIFNRNSIYMAFIVGGIALFVTYPGVVKTLPGLLSKVGHTDGTILTMFVAIFAAIAYGVYYTWQKKEATWNLILTSLLFVFLGFSTYAMVIIRSNQDPPMNENEPKTVEKLISYLNREQYGSFPTFKRRYAVEPHLMAVYQHYESDLDFWWRYQMNHMMTRYLLWNYAGREGWVQDQGVNVYPFNKVGNVFGKIFNLRFAGEGFRYSLLGIPFLLGLIGIYFHFKRDWKMALAFMVLFIFMGYLTAYYQNQQQPQPRERDYFYVGAFFVFSIWVGMAIRGFIGLIEEKVKSKSLVKPLIAGTLVLGFLLVPVRMVWANYHTHDRSGNYVPWDYAYNLLQSCAPNAVLFTNGDNDTFPLWYLQDVEGVRQDIRIANLSLINTQWYIKQLKNLEPYGAKKVRMSYTDEQVDRIGPQKWQTQTFTVPVPKEVYQEFYSSEGYQTLGIEPPDTVTDGAITFTVPHTISYSDIKAIRVQDLVVLDIVRNFNWERPIYFAVTTETKSKIGLDDYLQHEGMAMRLVPYKRKPGIEFVNEPVMRKQLYEEPEGFSTDYQPGFKYRGMDDPSVFMDDSHEKLATNYRHAYIRLALYYINTKQMDKAIDALDMMDKKIPRDNISLDYRILFDVGNLYYEAGAIDRYRSIAAEVEQIALKQIEENPTDVSSYWNPYRILLETYSNLKEYDKAIGVLKKLQALYPNDPTIQSMIQQYEMKKAGVDTTQ